MLQHYKWNRRKARYSKPKPIGEDEKTGRHPRVPSADCFWCIGSKKPHRTIKKKNFPGGNFRVNKGNLYFFRRERGMKEEVIKDEVYLYSILNGEMKVYKGKLIKTVYYSKGEFIGRKKRCHCDIDQGRVLNYVLWLEHPDFERALDLFIKHLESIIEQHQDHIFTARTKIKNLRENRHLKCTG